MDRGIVLERFLLWQRLGGLCSHGKCFIFEALKRYFLYILSEVFTKIKLRQTKILLYIRFNSLFYIKREKQNMGFMSAFICDKDRIAVLDKFLAKSSFSKLLRQ